MLDVSFHPEGNVQVSASFSLQLQFEINCGTDDKCVDNLNLDFNFTR